MSETKVIRNYYDKKQQIIKEEYFVMNGKKEGIYKSYHDNGKLCKEVNYIDGKKNGLCINYYKNGDIECETNYINNNKEGIYRKFSNNPKEKNYIDLTIGYYKNDKKNGCWKTYYYNNSCYLKNGKYYNDLTRLAYEICYNNDKEIGIYKQYYYSGELMLTINNDSPFDRNVFLKNGRLVDDNDEDYHNEMINDN